MTLLFRLAFLQPADMCRNKAGGSPLTGVWGGSEMSERTMLHAFVGLDATERADIVAALIRCRVLAAKIANELRNKRPEYFVDKLSLADIHASLERATDVLSTVKGSQAPGRQCHRRVAEMKMLDKTEQSDRANPNEKPENCYCSALPKGSGLCLPCYTRWLAGSRS